MVVERAVVTDGSEVLDDAGEAPRALQGEGIGDAWDDDIPQLAEQRAALSKTGDVWATHIRGLAFYRAGKFEKAIATLEAGQHEPDLTSEVKMSNWLVLAMCRSRQGQDGEAAAALQSALVILASAEGKPHRENRVVQILFHEAEALLREQ